MKKQQEKTCPGCHRHCPLNAVRCKYGRKYIAKQEEPAPGKHKWEACTTEGSPVRELLAVGHRIKKDLRHSRVTEAQLLAGLTAQEQEVLIGLLRRIGEDTVKE